MVSDTATNDVKDAVLALCRAPFADHVRDPNENDLWATDQWHDLIDGAAVSWLACIYTSANMQRRTATLVALLEAADIFAMLARVDLALWKAVTAALWKPCVDRLALRTTLCVGVDVRIQYEGDNAVEVDAQDKGDDVVAAIETIAMWLSNGPRSVAYTQVCGLVARRYGAALPVVPFRLNLQEYWFKHTNVPRILAAAHECFARVPSGVITGRNLQFKLGAWDGTIKGDDLETLQSMRALGIQIADVPVRCVRSQDLSCSQCFEFLRPLLDATPTPVGPSRRYATRQRQGPLPPGAECLVISTLLPEAVVPGVFSAIHSSRSARDVEIELDGTRQRATTLQWIAYALFCRPEPLALFNLDNSEKLRMTDFEHMRQILEAANPLALLFPEETHDDIQRVILASKGYLQHPNDAGNPTEWVDSTPSELAIVGKCRRGFWPVLLPGWGKAWVRDDQANIRAAQPHVVRSPTQLLIQSNTTVDTAAVVELMHLIGHDVKYVKIQEFNHSNVTLDGFCIDVFLACPALEELEIHNSQFDSVQFLLEAFKARDCPKLSRLTFFSNDMFCMFPFQTLLRTLADPAHVVAKQLRALNVHATIAPQVPREVPRLVAVMLHRNKWLREFVLSLPLNPHLAPVEAAFQRFDQQPLNAEALPVSRRAMLAFLSVARQRQRRNSALQRFDSFIYSRIFGFASMHRVRSVKVLFSRDD